MEHETINLFKKIFFLPMPDWLADRKEVSDRAKIVFSSLLKYCGKKGYCYPRYANIAKSVGRSTSYVKRGIAELRRFQLINSTRRGYKLSNNYVVYKHEWMTGRLRGDTKPQEKITNNVFSL